MQNKKIKYHMLTIHERINAKQVHKQHISYVNNPNKILTINLCLTNDIVEILEVQNIVVQLRDYAWEEDFRKKKICINDFYTNVYKRKTNVELLAICTSLRLKCKLFGTQAKQQREIDNFLEMF